MKQITQEKIEKECRGKIKERNNLRILRPDEYRRFFSVIPNDDHLFNLKFLFLTGMRISEAQSILVKDINLEHRIITVRRGKGNRAREVRFPTELKTEIIKRIKKKKLKKRDNLGILTAQRIRILMKFYGALAGIENYCDLRPHTARKTHETYLCAIGVNSMVISIHMGHTIDVAQAFYVTQTFSETEKEEAKRILGDIF